MTGQGEQVSRLERSEAARQREQARQAAEGDRIRTAVLSILASLDAYKLASDDRYWPAGFLLGGRDVES